MAGLRAPEIQTMVELIRGLRDEGVTVLAVEHVIKAIAAISDEICVLHHGEVLTHGAPQSVLSDTGKASDLEVMVHSGLVSGLQRQDRLR